jgi:hypothetical protein
VLGHHILGVLEGEQPPRAAGSDSLVLRRPEQKRERLPPVLEPGVVVGLALTGIDTDESVDRTRSIGSTVAATTTVVRQKA